MDLFVNNVIWVLIDPDGKRYEFENFDKLHNYIKGSFLHMSETDIFKPLMK